MNFTNVQQFALGRAERGRLHHWVLRYRWGLLFVGLPTLLATLYYGLIASPIYVSQSSFVIKSSGQKAAPTISLANLVQASGLSSGQEQTKEVVRYIGSRDALLGLQQRVNVRSAYSSDGADPLSRFPRPWGDDSFESFYRYYGSMVGADIDPESGLAEVQVHAFTAIDAYRINSRLLDLSEQLINRLNQRAESQAVAEAQQNVDRAEARLRNARIAISAYRNQADVIDPAKQASGLLELSNRLVGEQAALDAQVRLISRVAPRNPSLPALRTRLAALNNIIAAQNLRVTGSSTGLASKLAVYEKLNVEQEFATQMLTAASASLEQARTEAQKQQYYLERVVDPNQPDKATLPNKLKTILTVFGASLCLYFVGWMLVVGILEHAPED